MTPETVNAWFTPFHYFVYLGVILVILIISLQISWTKACDTKALLLIKMASGGGRNVLVPKDKGSITLEDPKTHKRKMWPINDLATITVGYPGLGLIPRFLQKTITMCIVDEEDWEPMLNRSAYVNNVASPDIITELKRIAAVSEGETKKRLEALTKPLHTAPTRAMIASPAVLGNLMNEKITEAVMTVTKEVMESLEALVKKLSKLVNPTVVYIGLGLILILVAFMVYKVLPALEGLENLAKAGNDLTLIKKSLGIP